MTLHLDSQPGINTVLVCLTFFTQDKGNAVPAKQANAYICALPNTSMETKSSRLLPQQDPVMIAEKRKHFFSFLSLETKDRHVLQEERISVTVQEGAELPLHCLRLDAPHQPDLWKEQYKV